MGLCKKDITPLLVHWSYVFLAQNHRNDDADWNINHDDFIENICITEQFPTLHIMAYYKTMVAPVH